MSKGPDFVGVGVQRGGTSWLYKCLSEHPEIFMPKKEVHFFNRHYYDGIQYYQELFDAGKSTAVKGEITPDYINSPKAIERLHEHYPNAKIIIILREPFERTYSAIGLLRSYGKFKDQSFDEIIQSNRWAVEQSLYSKQLEHLISLFGKDQVKVFFFEDIKRKPLWLVQQVCKFIGVDSEFEPTSLKEQVNRGGLDLTLFSGAINLVNVQSALKRNVIGKQLLKLKKGRAFKYLKTKIYSASETDNPKLTLCPQDLRDELINDIKKTEVLLNTNLKHWY